MDRWFDDPFIELWNVADLTEILANLQVHLGEFESPQCSGTSLAGTVSVQPWEGSMVAGNGSDGQGQWPVGGVYYWYCWLRALVQFLTSSCCFQTDGAFRGFLRVIAFAVVHHDLCSCWEMGVLLIYRTLLLLLCCGTVAFPLHVGLSF